MKRATKETSAEWISERMQAVISAYPKEEIEATIPVVVLFMAKEFGIERLEPKIRAAFDRIVERAGVTKDMGADEVARALDRHVGSLVPNVKLLEEIHAIFEIHRAAIGEEKTGDFAGMTGARKKKLPAMVGAPRPARSLNPSTFIRAKRA